MNKNLVMGLVAVLALGIVGFIMVSATNQKKAVVSVETSPSSTAAVSSPTPISATPSGTVTPSKSPASVNVKEIVVNGSNFKFDPTTITVKKGDKVKVVFKNVGGNHDFVIDEFNVQTKVIGSGLEDSVEFTANKVGTFEFYCSVGNHRAMGMTGKLIVQ